MKDERTYKKMFVEGLGWALVDRAGNLAEVLDYPYDPEYDPDYDWSAQERQAELEWDHGYNFED